MSDDVSSRQLDGTSGASRYATRHAVRGTRPRTPRRPVVGAGTVLPLSGLGSIWNFTVEGAPPPPPDVNAEIAIASITPDYFRAIGTPLRRGRFFTKGDRNEAPPVAIINEAAVRRWFPPGSARTARRRRERRERIVGVVADVLQRDPGQPAQSPALRSLCTGRYPPVRFVVRTTSAIRWRWHRPSARKSAA